MLRTDNQTARTRQGKPGVSGAVAGVRGPLLSTAIYGSAQRTRRARPEPKRETQLLAQEALQLSTLGKHWSLPWYGQEPGHSNRVTWHNLVFRLILLAPCSC